jgi:hypothetical protein
MPDIRQILLELLISKHASTKTLYAEKLEIIVKEFLGDPTDNDEEQTETILNAGDSVTYTGSTQRYNGRQLTTGMQGHVIKRVEVGFVKVQFEQLGRAVLEKTKLRLDGGPRLLSLTEQHWSAETPHLPPRLTSAVLAKNQANQASQRTCQGCRKTNDSNERVCTKCNALADKFHKDVEIPRDSLTGYVNMKYTLKEFKNGTFTERVQMAKIDEKIAERKLTNAYKKAIIERNGTKPPVYQARKTQNTGGSEASSSHQRPPNTSMSNNAAGPADRDTNWREQNQWVYSQTLQNAWEHRLYQQQQQAQTQYFWNLETSMRDANSMIQTNQSEEKKTWNYNKVVDHPNQTTNAKGIEAQEVRKSQEAEQENNDCVICFDKNKTHAIIPCGHHCVCGECAKILAGNNCPICRCKVEGAIHIFGS